MSSLYIPIFVVYGLLIVFIWGLIFVVLLSASKWISSWDVLTQFKELVRKNFLLIISFSELGLAIGLISGSSLSPVVGAIIPAILTFFGGLMIYIFTTKGDDDSAIRNGGMLAIFCVSFFLLYGFEVSATFRMEWTAEKETNEVVREDSLLKKEFELKQLQLEHELRQRFVYDSLLIEVQRVAGRTDK